MRTYIIAEIAQGFEGQIIYCKNFVKLAHLCGADAVKFQIFSADELSLPDYQFYSLFRSLEILPEEWMKVISLAHDLGIDFLADVYGPISLKWLLNSGANGFKIHSTDIKNYELLKELKDKDLNIFVSTGGSTLEEVKKAIDLLGKNKIVLLSGFQAEPNTLEDIELEKINQLNMEYGLKVGYADHIDANDPLAISLPAMAVLKGASVIEKHLTIERNRLNLEDCISALNPSEYVAMIDLIRKVEQFKWQSNYELSVRENDYRKRTKKIVLAAQDIQKGAKIQPEYLVMLRTGQLVTEYLDYDFIIGKKAKINIPKNSIIHSEDIE